MLIDTFGRVHNNLRVSVTDRCNLRCTYCMPEEVVFLDRAELLTFEEVVRFVRVAVPLGIDKVRLTGGEPLMRRDGLEKVLEGIAAARGAGFDPVKVNAVSIRGFTEHEVVPLARFARGHG